MTPKKKKICYGKSKYHGQGCGQERYIFAYGLCQWCYNRVKASENRKKPVKRTPIPKYKPQQQDNHPLSERNTFLSAYKFCGGKCFIGGDLIQPSELKAWNCMHVLNKKNYPYFKYYYRNVVIGHKAQHDLIDQGTLRGIIRRIHNTHETKDMWRAYFGYRQVLLEEYKRWVKENPKRYKLV